MKILIASSSISLQGGVPAYNRELCNMLGKEHEMHLLVQQNVNHFEGFQKVISISNRIIPTIDESKHVLSILRSEKYDVIINSNSHIISLISPYINNNTIIIGISHSVRYTESDTAAFNSQYIDKVIALSGFNKTYLEKKFNLAIDNKCVMISNFVAYDRNADSKRLAKKNQVPTIVFAGGSASTKSPELIVKIVRKLLETDLKFKFIWLGIKTPPLKKIQPFNDMSILFPEDSRVNFRGQISREEAAEIISNANIFLAPSRREGCPISLLEAMRIGTISIVSDYNIANKEIIKDGVNGFIINHKKTKLFVERISDIIKNPNKYNSIYEESYYTFCNELSFDVWKKKMDMLISSSKTTHVDRLQEFDLTKFKEDTKTFIKMHKANLAHMFVHETIPSALSCLMLYLTYHRKQ